MRWLHASAIASSDRTVPELCLPRAERLRRRRKATSPEPLEGSGERRNFLKCACCPPQGGWIVAEVKIS